uniref:Ovule protein n=1 Tax=Mesocestoides corti TaxID=53468 RepID=A0A5K3F839_MESCO
MVPPPGIRKSPCRWTGISTLFLFLLAFLLSSLFTFVYSDNSLICMPFVKEPNIYHYPSSTYYQSGVHVDAKWILFLKNTLFKSTVRT